MKVLKIVPWMVVAALLLASCTNGDANPTDNTPASSGYPSQAEITVASVNSAYPGPTDAPAPGPTAVPTPLTLRPPADGKANIHGILTAGPDKSPDKTYLLLARAVPADKAGFAPMLSYSDDSSPRAVMDDTGLFVFFDVDPGQYGIVIASPIGGATIPDPSLNPPQPLIVTVAAGDNKDLGTLNTP